MAATAATVPAAARAATTVPATAAVASPATAAATTAALGAGKISGHRHRHHRDERNQESLHHHLSIMNLRPRRPRSGSGFTYQITADSIDNVLIKSYFLLD
jgi:hypothetical protein